MQITTDFCTLHNHSICIYSSTKAILPVAKSGYSHKYLKSYKTYNPHQNDVSHIRHDMELLINQKNKMFPEVKKPIVNAEIKEVEGKYTIFAASVRTD